MTELDLILESDGPRPTVYLVRGVTDAGTEWLQGHLAIDDETQYWNGSVVVEHRFIQDIVNEALNDGLVVGGS